MDLKEKLLQKQAKVGIVGLGYVGLPIAITLIQKGYTVLGVDLDIKRVKMLAEGNSYIIDISNEVLQEAVHRGFEVSTNYQMLKQADVILICVPTPLNTSKEPNLSYIIKAMDGICTILKKKTLIVLESTTYPGTTQELIVERIEKEKDWKVGKDFYVCFSPERVDPGNKHFHVGNTPKVIGGATKTCLEVGMKVYQSFLEEVMPVSSTQVAEMSKLLENTFRCINIAMINEMSIMCERMKINIWEVIKAAQTKPFGFMPFYPGPGIGGHCIPLDPLYLSWEGKKHNYFNRFIELASDINGNMPRYVVKQIQDILDSRGKSLKDSQVLLMGMAYKKDIDDLRESPALEVYELLIQKGAHLSFYDSYVEQFNRGDTVVKRIKLSEEEVKKADLVVIITDHSNIDYKWIEHVATCIYDTRNAMKDIESDKIIKLGDSIAVREEV